MGTPTKKRKLNDTKAAPVPARNLDFFFNKQKQPRAEAAPTPANKSPKEETGEPLTDEDLARKLQAEWAAEDCGAASASQATKDSANHGTGTDLPENTAGENLNGVTPELENPPKQEISGAKPKINPSESKPKNTLTLQSVGDAEESIASNVPFDQSPLTFDPSKYITELQKHWATEGGDASYALLTRCFVLINSTQSRIKIVDTLVNLLRVLIEGDPSSLLPTVRSVSPALCRTSTSPSMFVCVFIISLPSFL